MFKTAALYFMIGGSINGLAEMGCSTEKLQPICDRLMSLNDKIPTNEELQKDLDKLDDEVVIKLSALIDELEEEVKKQ